MKKFSRSILALSFLALFFVALAHAVQPLPMSLAALQTHPLTSSTSAAFVGGGVWGEIGAGIVCGAGIVGIAAGGLSGVALPAAIIAVSGVAGACVAAFD